MQELFKNVLKVLTADRLGAFFIAPDSVSPTPLLLPGHFANEQTTFLVLQYHSFCFRSHMSGVAPWKCARERESRIAVLRTAAACQRGRGHRPRTSQSDGA